jgi:DNA-binding beta-propeller fold protein YncE
MSDKNVRRSFIKKSLLASTAGLLLPRISLANTAKSKKMEKIVGQGDFKYKVDAGWGIQDPNVTPVDNCHEMVMDAQGRILMTTTHPKNNVLIYDRSGKILSTWEVGLPGAHGLTIVGEGKDQFLFITDPDTHKVKKTTLDGRVLMTFECPKEFNGYDKPEQFKPTETAVAPNGDIYIADGYGENYIIQYDSKGNYVRHFGGKGDGADQFDCCHGVTLDTRDASNPTLLITSRSKQEFKRFTLDGQHLETISLPGCWICRPVINGKNIFFAVIVTKSWDAYDGMIAVLDENNKVVSFPGGMAPEYVDGTLKDGTYDGSTFMNPHDVCLDNDGNLYVPQWNSGKTYPFKLNKV